MENNSTVMLKLFHPSKFHISLNRKLIIIFIIDVTLFHVTYIVTFIKIFFYLFIKG
jgi:hypothetical protein